MNVDLHQALHHDPFDEVAWLALADWLEERGEVTRAEMLRLITTLRTQNDGPRRRKNQRRLLQLLEAGIDPRLPVITNTIGMEMVLIPPGRFWMGSSSNEPYHSPDEGPIHEVEITHPFYLGKFPVTQHDYLAVTGLRPSHFAADGPLPYYRLIDVNTENYPVDSISYEDALWFCHQLSALPAEQDAKRVYRLPTEAEWEYACRAGTNSVFYHGDSLGSERANFDGNYPYGGAEPGVYLKRTCAVGQFRPNAFGLHDLLGNVWEWCSDWFSENYYKVSPERDPTGPVRGESRVLRGGSWIDASWHCRCADRSHREALHYVGFRVAMTLHRS